MASTLTTELSLVKATPGTHEPFSTATINSNYDLIDAKFNNTTGHKHDSAHNGAPIGFSGMTNPIVSPHFTGPVVDSGGLTVTSGGLTVTAGGLTVTAGGLTVTTGQIGIGTPATTQSIATADGGTARFGTTNPAAGTAAIQLRNGTPGNILWRNAAANADIGIGSDGSDQLVLLGAWTTNTGAPGAGGGGALPVNAATYLRVVVNGTTYKVPLCTNS